MRMKMAKKPERSVKTILNNKRSNTLSLISQQFARTQKAQKALSHFDIPYFAHVKVSFFDGKKLVFSTTIPELIGKFRELESALIHLLKSEPLFCDLCEIKTKLYFPQNQQHKDSALPLSQNTKERFEKLANYSDNKAISQAIDKLLKKSR